MADDHLADPGGQTIGELKRRTGSDLLDLQFVDSIEEMRELVFFGRRIERLDAEKAPDLPLS